MYLGRGKRVVMFSACEPTKIAKRDDTDAPLHWTEEDWKQHIDREMGDTPDATKCDTCGKPMSLRWWLRHGPFGLLVCGEPVECRSCLFVPVMKKAGDLKAFEYVIACYATDDATQPCAYAGSGDRLTVYAIKQAADSAYTAFRLRDRTFRYSSLNASTA
jgi:hypothetical protein